MPPTTCLRLNIAGASGAAFVVLGSRRRERMNGLYSLRVELLAPADDGELEAELCGREALLSLDCDDGRSRVFYGVVRGIHALGNLGEGRILRTRYVFEIAPRAWLMGLRKTSRIFQGMRIDDVIRAVLAPYAIPSRWIVVRSLPACAYITQFEETDLAFVERLLAEAGIFYTFEHPPAGDAGEAGAAGLTDSALAEMAQRVVSANLGALASGGADGPPAIDGLLLAATATLEAWRSPREVMVMSDTPAGYAPLRLGDTPPWDDLVRATTAALGNVVGVPIPTFASSAPATLPVRHDSGSLLHPNENVLRLERRVRVTPRNAVYREFDPRRPNVVLGASRSRGEGANGALGQLESLAQNVLEAVGTEAVARFENSGDVVFAGLEDVQRA